MEQPITFEHIFTSTSNCVIATDAMAQIVLVNEQAEKILELARDNITGAFIDDILPMTGRYVNQCLLTGTPQLGRHIHEKNISLVVNVTLIQDGENILGTVINFQKLQEFEHSARRLESYEQLNKQLETVINSSADGIWVYDGEGNVITVNKAAIEADEIKAEDVIGRNVYDLMKSDIFDRSVVIEVFEMKRQITI